ncbi:MAG: glycosyltransferase family 2 protein [Dermatophilaceae bacterium]
MDAPVDVSVIIVNWNTRDLLLAVIDSVRTTTQSARIEVIVVDNDSHDGSVAALRERHPDVTVISNPDNYGFARANNIGFRAAEGHAYCLVNTDVIALDGVIDTLWQFLETHPSAGAVGPETLDGAGRLRRDVRRFPSLRNAAGDHLWLRRLLPRVFPGRSLPPQAYRSTRSVDVLPGSFLMVRRQAVTEVGPLDETFFFYGEDTDWAKRFHDAGWDCVYLPQARAIHLGGSSTAAAPVHYYLEIEKSDLRYWGKHHGRGAVAAYVAIRLVHNLVSVVAWSVVWLCRSDRRDSARLRVRGNVLNTVWLITRRTGA